MPFGWAADAWIAAHARDRIYLHCDQSNADSKARNGIRCLATGMTTSNHYYAKIVHRHSYCSVRSAAGHLPR
jgi:hypothetical protein